MYKNVVKPTIDFILSFFGGKFPKGTDFPEGNVPNGKALDGKSVILFAIIVIV